MDRLSQWCLRLRSTQLRFRDCSEIVQTHEVELCAQTGCSRGGSPVLVMGGWEMSQRGAPQLQWGAGRMTAAVQGRSDGAQRAVAGGMADLPCPLQEGSPGPGMSLPPPRPATPAPLGPVPVLCSHPQLRDAGAACHPLSAWVLRRWVTRQKHVQY